MGTASILTFLVLSFIFYQDLKFKAVYWWVFPLLSGLLGWLAYPLGMSTMLTQFGWNTGFLLIQLLLLSIYFAVKNGRFLNITAAYLGLGDILFLTAIGIYLSFLNFVFFYLISLLLIVFFELLKSTFSKTGTSKIPLAGYQSLLLLGWMLADQSFLKLDLTHDSWLLTLITN